jgi:hypothetical protein
MVARGLVSKAIALLFEGIGNGLLDLHRLNRCSIVISYQLSPSRSYWYYAYTLSKALE